MEALKIKLATVSDAGTLADLGKRTFTETFAPYNSIEDMELYVGSTFKAEKQRDELLDPHRRVAIAWIENHAAGYCHWVKGPADPSIKGDRPIELLRLYVDSRWHGKGIGPALMNHCLESVRQEGFGTLWLGVWERNFRAQAFYRKFSFVEVGQHIFTLGTDNQTDLIMTRPI